MYVLYILLASTPRINAAAVSYMSIPIVDGTSDTDPSGYKAYLNMQRYLPMDLKQANPMSCVESSFSKIRRHREKEASNIIFFSKRGSQSMKISPMFPQAKIPVNSQLRLGHPDRVILYLEFSRLWPTFHGNWTPLETKKWWRPWKGMSLKSRPFSGSRFLWDAPGVLHRLWVLRAPKTKCEGRGTLKGHLQPQGRRLDYMHPTLSDDPKNGWSMDIELL